MSCCSTFFAQSIHANDIKTNVNISQVAPQAVVEDSARLAIQRLHQLQGAVSQQRTKSTAAWQMMPQQNPTITFIITIEHLPVFKNSALVINNFVVAQDIFIKIDASLHVAYADDKTRAATREFLLLQQPLVSLLYLEKIVVGVFHKKITTSVGRFHYRRKHIELCTCKVGMYFI